MASKRGLLPYACSCPIHIQSGRVKGFATKTVQFVHALKESPLQIYIFRSETDELSAYAGDASGSKLPSQFAPWQPDGTIEAGEVPPHNMSRYRIESAIKLHGYQLWRLKRPTR